MYFIVLNPHPVTVGHNASGRSHFKPDHGFVSTTQRFDYFVRYYIFGSRRLDPCEMFYPGICASSETSSVPLMSRNGQDFAMSNAASIESASTMV